MTANVRISTGLPDADPVVGDTGLFDLLAERLRRRPRSFLYFVPTRLLTRRFAHRMFERGLSAFIADQAHTLNDFAVQALAGLRPELRAADDLQRILVINRLVTELAIPDLGENAAEFPGLTAALADAVKRLKQALISPEDYARHLSKTGASPKARALAQIYSHYERELQRLRAIDEQGVFAALADAPIEHLAAGPLAGRELIVFHGFYDFTPAQLRLVTMLRQCARDVLFVLDYEEARDKVFGPVRQLVADTCEARQRRSGPMPPPIENAARHLFTAPSAVRVRMPAEGCVRLIAAKDRRQEVESIAADIKRSRLNENISLRQIGLTFPNPGAYDSLVREIFPRMGLQFNLARGFPLDRSMVVSAIFKMLEVVQSDYQRERVTELFYSPCVSLHFASPDGTTRLLSPLALDRVAREAGVIRGETDWTGKLQQHLEALGKEVAEIAKGVIDPETDGDAARQRESLEQRIASATDVAGAMSQVLRELSALRTKQTLPAFCETLRGLVRKFSIAAGITPREPSPLPPIELEKAFRALAKFESVLEAVEHEGEQHKQATCELSAFLALLQNAVSAEEYQVQTYTDAGVQVMGLLDLRGTSFRRLYVGGMLNGDFPSPSGRSIFFSESEAESLGLPGRTRHDAEQRFHFLSLLCSARERIVFSYPLTESGDPTVRSPFIDELLSFFPEESVVRVAAGEEAFSSDRLFRRLGEELSRPPNGARWAAELVLSDSPLSGPARRIRRCLVIQQERASRASSSPYMGVLSDECVLKELARSFGANHRFSVTQLEIYATCPFRFFCKQALLLEELAVPEEEVTPASRGGVIHEMLRRFYTERRRQSLGRPTEADVAEARDELVRLARDVFGGLPFSDLFWQKDVDRVVRPQGLVDAFLGIEAAGKTLCEPRLFEFAFGSSSRMQEIDPDSAKPPLKLDRGTLLVGKIDRVEVSADRRGVVVDYKTGGAGLPSIKRMLDGESYQLPLYLLAIQELLGLTPVGGVYYRVRDAYQCGRSVQLADAGAAAEGYVSAGKGHGVIPNKRFDLSLADVIAQAKKRALDVVAQIRAGHFPLAEPDGSKAACRHCEFSYICRASDTSEDEGDDASQGTDTGAA